MKTNSKHLLGTVGLLSVIGGVGLHLLLFTALRIQTPHERIIEKSGSFVGFGNDRVTSGFVSLSEEKGLLFDSAPLFMPTPWNQASALDEVASLQQATNLFPVFAPKLLLNDFQFAFDERKIREEPSLIAILRGGAPADLSWLWREELPQVLPSEVSVIAGPHVSLWSISNVQEISNLEVEISPQLLKSAPEVLWQKVTFQVLVHEGRKIGRAYLKNRSGINEWDERLVDWLESSLFYTSLNDGYYRIEIFP